MTLHAPVQGFTEPALLLVVVSRSRDVSIHELAHEASLRDADEDEIMVVGPNDDEPGRVLIDIADTSSDGNPFGEQRAPFFDAYAMKTLIAKGANQQIAV